MGSLDLTDLSVITARFGGADKPKETVMVR